MEVITHFSHEHELILNRNVINEGVDKILCDGCTKEISGSAYTCEDCEFFLHERCSQLPMKINHPMHLEHPYGPSAPLVLQKPMFPICNVCRYKCLGFTYACKVCDFDVCLSCFLQEEDVIIQHNGHPPHPLKVISRRAKFFCDACHTTEEENDSYSCTICEYWIHKSCALLQDSIECSGHHHPLFLEYSLPSVNRHFHCNCDVCGKQVYRSYWLYHCAGCRYFAHVKCATALEQRLGDDPSKITSEIDLDANLVQLPMADKSADSLIQLIIKLTVRLGGDISEMMMPKNLEHWSHNHPLVLLYDHDGISNITIKEERVLCNGCVLPIISFPFYACQEEYCNFFLHTFCSRLSSGFQLLPSHPEQDFSLGAPPSIYHTFKCDCCSERCNGFFFEEKDSEIELCIRCASSDPTIKHESHHHPLVFKKSESYYKVCKSGCGYGNMSETLSYQCETCSDFQIRNRCAMLPRTVMIGINTPST